MRDIDQRRGRTRRGRDGEKDGFLKRRITLSSFAVLGLFQRAPAVGGRAVDLFAVQAAFVAPDCPLDGYCM